MKGKILTTKVITEIALFGAIAFALDLFQGGYSRAMFANGGSIGIAMLPILVLCYRRGFLAGLLSGIVVTFLQFLGGFYAIADTWYNVLLQIALDYILAYPVVALAGLFFKKFKEASDNKGRIVWLSVGTIIGGLAKLLCHYLAGVIFWSYTCPENFLGGPAVYSLVYNGGFCIPNIVLCLALLIVIVYKQPKIFLLNKKESEDVVNEK